ncbi:MAG: hypothetical protein JST85_13525 [Acidobacteria bacterium]|nr:hypothetical protein [Acidobacteriota bacterium]
MLKESLGIVKRHQVGGEVETRCGKCKEVRSHTIVALKEDTGEIARVQCGFCNSNHIFRPPKTKTASTRTSSRGTKKDAALLESSGPPRPYSMQERFSVGDRLEHPKFGSGVVMEVRSGKIDVKFGREMKTLIHAA